MQVGGIRGGGVGDPVKDLLEAVGGVDLEDVVVVFVAVEEASGVLALVVSVHEAIKITDDMSRIHFLSCSRE